MKVKSAKAFRYWYKTRKLDIDRKNRKYNENFLGTFYESGGSKIKGFFQMFHGDKPNIKGYLPSILKIAEDGQAIYEFLQNAVDCKSTHFYIFYNESYFLAINNGEPFDREGVQSVLNIAQTTKHSCDKIGRFGIGFKLVHRLVGQNEGVEELTEHYKGPVMFSWSKWEHMKDLLEGKRPQPVTPSSKDEEKHQAFVDAPFLMKLLLTNFPADVGETVKNLKYEDFIPFPYSELEALSAFLNKSFNDAGAEINENILRQGSLFFIRLGEGKKEMLDREYEELKTGVEFSMNTLKNLSKVYINNKAIGRQPLKIEEFIIKKGSDAFNRINPEHKKCPIKVAIGFYAEDYRNSERIKTAPNFYKYFPMGDETNGFNFIVHSDSFSIESNRRKLQKDKVNENLLPEIAKLIIEKLDEYRKQRNRILYLELYAALLLSEVPDRDNNKWMKAIFHNIIMEYLKRNVPVKEDTYTGKRENIKINRIPFEVNLAELGLGHIKWFEWSGGAHRELLKSARDEEKLNLKVWGISQVVEQAQLDALNNWIASREENYEALLEELEKSPLIKELKDKLVDVKLFKFSDGQFYAATDLVFAENLIFHDGDTIHIDDKLKALGFITSNKNIESFSRLYGALEDELPSKVDVFNAIAKRAIENDLDPNDKRVLFEALSSFKGIGEQRLRELKLFRNNKGEVSALENMIIPNGTLPSWLSPYSISRREYFSELDEHLISDKDIYSKVIVPLWENLEPTDLFEFYEKVTYYFNRNETNSDLPKSYRTIYVSSEEKLLPPSNVFFSNKLTNISNYEDLRQGVMSLSGLYLPDKKILGFLSKSPFNLSSSAKIKSENSGSKVLSLESLKAVLEFYKESDESFFKAWVVEPKGEAVLRVTPRNDNLRQVSPYSEDLKIFIEKYLSDSLKVLSPDLEWLEDDPHVARGEDLDKLVLSSADIAMHKESLINLLKYDDAKRKLLLSIHQFTVDVDKSYSEDSYEYKVFELACKLLQEEQYQNFRQKITLIESQRRFNLSNIQLSRGSIEVEGIELDLAELLPDSHSYSKPIKKLLAIFSTFASSLNDLLGLEEDKTAEEWFLTMKSELGVFSPKRNERIRGLILKLEQLLLIVLISKRNRVPLEFEKFYVFTNKQNGHFPVPLTGTFYLSAHPFIEDKAILSKEYYNLSKLTDTEKGVFLNPDETQTSVRFIDKPLLIPSSKNSHQEASFYCPNVSLFLLESEAYSLLKFLLGEWLEEENQAIIRAIDWSKIDDYKTKDLLGFTPNKSVYPDRYALPSEVLPQYVKDFIAKEPNAKDLLKAMGVRLDDSPLIKVRGYFLGEVHSIDQELLSKLSSDVDKRLLYETLVYFNTGLKLTPYLDKNEKYHEGVLLIVKNLCSNEPGSTLSFKITLDIESNKVHSREWEAEHYKIWKKELKEKFTIYLSDLAIGRKLSLAEDNAPTSAYFRSGQDAIDKAGNIYIHKDFDIKEALGKIASSNSEDFTPEDLLKLYQEEDNSGKDKRIQDLEKEVERLKALLNQREAGEKRDSSDITTQDLDNTYIKRVTQKSERFVFEQLKRKYAGYTVEWLNQRNDTGEFEESFEPYDFRVIDSAGKVLHYVDCKGTVGDKKTFYVTQDEWKFIADCLAEQKSYQIYRVFNTNGEMRCTVIDNISEWFKKHDLVPYSPVTEMIKGGRVALTLKT